MAYSIDFFIPPNCAIEVDGEYWHSLPKVEKADKRKERTIRLLGFRLFRLKEHDIRQNVKQCVEGVLCQI